MCRREYGLLCVLVLLAALLGITVAAQQATDGDEGSPAYELYSGEEIPFGSVPIGDILWVEYEVSNYRTSRLECTVSVCGLPLTLASNMEEGITPSCTRFFTLPIRWRWRLVESVQPDGF